MGRDMELVTVTKLNDQLSGQMGQSAAATVGGLQRIIDADEKLAVSSQKVSQATTVRMSASRQAELAIKAEADADNYLELQIARVNEEYAQLRAQAAAQIGATGQVEEATLKAAAAIKEKGERLTMLRSALDSVTGGLASMPPVLAAITVAVNLAKYAWNSYFEALEKVDVSDKKLADGVSTMELLGLRYKALQERFKDTGPMEQAINKITALMANVATPESLKQRVADAARADAMDRIETERRKKADEEVLELERLQRIEDYEAQQERAAAAQRAAQAQRQALQEHRQLVENIAGSWQRMNDAADQMYIKQAENARKLAEQAEREATAKQRAAIRLQETEKAWDNENAAAEAARNKADETEQQKIYRQKVQLAEQFGNIASDGIVQLIRGEERASAVLAQMVVRAIQFAAQMKLAALAQAGALSPIGAFGGFLGLGVLGALPALFSKKADGGFVDGGIPGRDSVPVLAMPGEYFASLREIEAARRNPDAAVSMMRRILSGPGSSSGSSSGVQHFADGGFVGPSGYDSAPNGVASIRAGGNTYILQSLDPTYSDLERLVRRTIPIHRQLVREGA